MAGAFRLNVRCRVWLFLLAAGCTFGSVPVLAGDWNQTLTLPATLEYDSNLPLSATKKQGVSRLIVVPAYNLIGTYGIDELKAGLGLNVERSADQRVSMNRQDPNLRLGWRHLTETGEFSLTTTYSEVSSRAAELQDTGGITTDSTRKTKSLGGAWSSAITELSTLTANADYNTVSYDAGTQSNYNNVAAGISWRYAWSERINPFLSFTVNHSVPTKSTATGGGTSDNYTVTGGVKVNASERIEWTAQGGLNRVSAQTNDTGWQGSVDMKYRGGRYDAALIAGRSAVVSGDGGFVAADRVTAAFSYAIGERSSAGLTASWQVTKGNSPNAMQQLGAWASHELSPFWNARLSYQHKLRSQIGQPDASGDALGLTLVYSPRNF
jgi:hypothetical protein